MQSYKSIRLSPTTIKVIEKLCANKDTNQVFRRNLSSVLSDYKIIAGLLGLDNLKARTDWDDIKESFVDFKVESSDYIVTTVTLTSQDTSIIGRYAIDKSTINYSGTINTMLEELNVALYYLGKPAFTKREWAALKTCYSKIPLHKLRISDEIILAKNSLFMGVKEMAGKNNRQYDRLIAKISNLSCQQVLILCCSLRELPVSHCNSIAHN